MSTQAGLGVTALIFGLVAVYFLYAGFTTPILVATDAGAVANLQMIQIQSLNFWLGIGASIIAALFAVGAAIVGALDR
jgi:hypothetical protein